MGMMFESELEDDMNYIPEPEEAISPFDFGPLEEALKDVKVVLNEYLAKGFMIYRSEVRDIRDDIYRLEDDVYKTKSMTGRM